MRTTTTSAWSAALLAAALLGPGAAYAQDARGGGPGAYPTPTYSCTRGPVRSPPKTFSVSYRPFPEPFAMFGAQMSEAAETHLAELGLKSAPRNVADVVVTIRYAHAEVGRRRGAAHHGIAFMLVGFCPTTTANYFKNRAELLDLVDRFVDGRLKGDDSSRRPHIEH